MPINRSENTKDKDDSEVATNKQPFGLQLAVVFAGVLIILPLLPAFITNLAYSFSGHAPKIYWYLSRSGGFIALSILWVSMAMGLGLTNKLARVWPGASTAFAIHEYVSLLGLIFAAYHGLVLMGDHYVDFSLPRLLVPFSIRYEPFWVGLGQVAFYTWVIVLASFYVRQHIGQKTWRMIHYANFATYIMGLFHGLFSGTDGTASWAHWYYEISGGSLIALVVYRVYTTVHKRPVSRPRPVGQVVPSSEVSVADAPIPAVAAIIPQVPALEQVSLPSESPAPAEEPVPVPEPIQVSTVTESIPQPVLIEQEEMPTSEYVTTETQLPSAEQIPFTIKIFDEIPIPPADPVLRLKRNPRRNETQIPADQEPVTLPALRINRTEQSKQPQLSPLILRIKENLSPRPTLPPLLFRSKKREEILDS